MILFPQFNYNNVLFSWWLESFLTYHFNFHWHDSICLYKASSKCFLVSSKDHQLSHQDMYSTFHCFGSPNHPTMINSATALVTVCVDALQLRSHLLQATNNDHPVLDMSSGMCLQYSTFACCFICWCLVHATYAITAWALTPILGCIFLCFSFPLHLVSYALWRHGWALLPCCFDFISFSVINCRSGTNDHWQTYIACVLPSAWKSIVRFRIDGIARCVCANKVQLGDVVLLYHVGLCCHNHPRKVCQKHHYRPQVISFLNVE